MWKSIIFAIALTQVYAEKSAVVYLSDPSGPSNVSGNVTFTSLSNSVLITGRIVGLGQGNHGFHIHALGNIGPGCTGTGPHFDPHNMTHGAPEDKVRHVGDLGNIIADASGVANINFTDNVIDLTGEHNIIGRAVVVHADPDDLGRGGNAASLETGNAGARVACGVIGLLTETSSSSRLTFSNWFIMTGAIFAFSLKVLLS